MASQCVRGCCKSLDLNLGLQKSDIHILSQIAKGPESIVYKGSLNGDSVAVKCPILSTAEDMNRFHQELQLLSELSHPHMAVLVAARAYPPDYSLLFRYYEGGNLSDSLHKDEWKPNSQQVVDLSLQLASVLQYLHGRGIVHRDIKPANVLLDEEGKIHLSDFGLAAKEASLSKHSATNWKKGSGKPTGGFHKKNMVGTLQYMAPEVLRKEVHSTKSDVFSFAVTVNELATGVLPYSDRMTDAQAHTVLEMNYTEQLLAAAITSENLRPVSTEDQSLVNCGFVDFIKRCWSQAPDARPSMDEVVVELSGMAVSLAELSGNSVGKLARSSPADPVALNGTKDRLAGIHDQGIEFTWADQARADVAASGAASLLEFSTSGCYTPVISAGAFATAGAREKMEDRHFMEPLFGGMKGVHAFGVFDGHRGFEAAEYAAASVSKRLLANLTSMKPPEALSDAFISTDVSFRAELDVQRVFRKGGGTDWHPGCTATSALIISDRIYVANAGDCRTVLCRNGKAVPLSRDHVASDPAERERICQVGGTVQWRVNTWRVGKAAIEVTRSLGDGDLKPAVTAEPEVVEHVLTADDEFLVMASDGLYEKLSNEDVIGFVHDTVKEPSMCGKRLAIEAVNRGSRDNITVVVVYLRPVSTVERVY